MGRIYQQTFINTYCKLAIIKLYNQKHAITSTDLLNDRVVPFFEEYGISLLRVLTDRGSEYCGSHEKHEYQLYLDLEDMEHTRTKVKHPQTNGICERFHKTVQNEFYATAFRRKIYNSIEELQAGLDTWVLDYNEQPTHSGKYCFGKTPRQTFLDNKHIAIEKQLNRTHQTTKSALVTA